MESGRRDTCRHDVDSSTRDGAADDFADAEPVELVHAFLYRDFPSDMGVALSGIEDGDVRLALRDPG